MKIEITFPAPRWESLISHLFGTSAPETTGYDEHLAFALAAPSVSADTARLAVREILPAGHADLTHQSPGGIAPSGEFVAAALTRCRQEGWSLIEVHSHPFSRGEGTSFSGIDWSSDRRKMPRVAHLLPDNSFHATMVIGRESLDAHYFDRDSTTIQDVSLVTVHGVQDGVPRTTRITPTSASRESGARRPFQSEARHDRQLVLFGPEMQEQLAKSTVVVVGLGGLGSFAALECAYLGFGGLVLVDPDDVEPSNLNRLIGATDEDVGRPKAEVYADLIRAIAPKSVVEAVPASILSDAALRLAKNADMMLGCVDSHGARLVMNQLAVQYVVPFIDSGSGIRLDGECRASQAGGQIQVVLPGLGCLECRGFIDARQAAYDLAPPHIRQRELAHGYGTQDPAPSVVFLNGTVASLLVAEAVKVHSGPSQGQAASPILLYDLLRQSLTRAEVQRSDTCTTCGTDGVTALADLSPLHEAGSPSAAPPERWAPDA